MNNNGTIETSDPNNSEIIQQNNYYPFGLEFQGTNYHITPQENQYKYNGKELQSDFGLNWYDYGFRSYDPQIGTWHTIDPMAESAIDLTPYRYAFNNPVVFSDFMGLWETDDEGNKKTSDANEIARLFGFLLQTPNASTENIGDFITMDEKSNGGGTTILSDDKKSSTTFMNPVTATGHRSQGGELSFSTATINRIHDQIDAVRNNRLWKSDDNLKVLEAGFISADYQYLMDNSSKIVNVAQVLQGLSQMGLQAARSRNAASFLSHLSRKLPRGYQIGTQKVAEKLRGGVSKSLGKMGRNLGIAGIILQGADYINKGIDGNLKTSDHVAAVMTGVSVAFPIFGIVYGATNLIWSFSTGKSLEQSIFD